MLEYIKTVLKGVSFDAFLFEKELKKGLLALQDDTKKEELLRWCQDNFGTKYSQVLQHYNLVGNC
jgi:hypothetical protein